MIGAMPAKKAKQSFFEKKDQKTFARAGVTAGHAGELRFKSFLVLFFKKELLLFLALPTSAWSACPGYSTCPSVDFPHVLAFAPQARAAQAQVATTEAATLQTFRRAGWISRIWSPPWGRRWCSTPRYRSTAAGLRAVPHAKSGVYARCGRRRARGRGDAGGIALAGRLSRAAKPGLRGFLPRAGLPHADGRVRRR